MATRKELGEKVSNNLIQLENAVEASTVARMNGRTGSNRMTHKRHVDSIVALLADYIEIIELPEKQYDPNLTPFYIEDTGGRRLAGYLKEQEAFQNEHGTGSDYMDGFNTAIDQSQQILDEKVKELRNG